MDVHWIDWILGVVAVSDGDETKRINTAFQLGILSSALEHAIPEQMFSTAENPADAISAVKALQKASMAGQRVYHITNANKDAILPNIHHNSLTMSEIRDALNAGKEVITHTDSVSVPGWSGAGYILFDPETGSGAYKIGGGKNGGWSSAEVGMVLFLLAPLWISVAVIAPAVALAFNILMGSAVLMLFMAEAMHNSGYYEAEEYLCGTAYALIITSLMLLFKSPFKAASVAHTVMSAMVGAVLGTAYGDFCSNLNLDN